MATDVQSWGLNDGARICERCYPDLLVYGEVVPGYMLAYQQDAERDVPARYFALFADRHKPFCVFPIRPVKSTYDQHTREEVDSWADDDPRHAEEDRHQHAVESMQRHFCMDPVSGYHLVQACLAAGYHWENCGMVLYWLSNRMADLIERHETQR